MSLATTAFAIQRQLFPMLEEEIGPPSDKEQRFVQVVELCHPERFMSPFQWAFLGHKPEDRLPLAKAFIAKSVWNFPTTRALLDYLQKAPSVRRLCGWETVSQLKDNFGALFVRVRGAAKVMYHRMFGVWACAALQILQRLPG